MLRIAPCLLLAGCCCFGGGGGGGDGGGFVSDFIGEQIAEEVTRRAVGAEDVDVRSDGSVEMTGPDGSTFTVGENRSMPADFPFAACPNANIGLVASAGESTTVSMACPGDLASVESHVRLELSKLGDVNSGMNLDDGQGGVMKSLTVTPDAGGFYSAMLIASPGDPVQVTLSASNGE